VLRKTFGECAVLIGWLQARDVEGMRDAQFPRLESLLNVVHEMDQTRPCINVFFGPSDFLGNGLDGLQLHQGGVAASFVEFVHVGALQFQALDIGEFADGRRNGVFPANCEARNRRTPATSS
jgi:hypothetical protein